MTARAIRRTPNGLKTDYLWKQVLTRGRLTDIIENYAQIVETKDDRTKRKRTRADMASLPPVGRGAPALG